MKVESLVLVPLGGLCNRLRAILSAIALAQKVQAPLHIIWLRDSGLNARFDDLFLPLDSHLLPPECRVELSVEESAACFRYGVARRRNLWLPALWQRASFDVCLSEADLLGILKQHPLDDRFAVAFCPLLRGKVLIQTGLGFFPTDDRLFQHFFMPSEPVRQLLTPRLGLLNGHTVGLHIRRTDNSRSAAHSPLSAFVEAMEADVASDALSIFYLATDDPAVVTSLQSLFPTRILTSPHQDVGASSSSRWARNAAFYSARSSVAGMQEAVAELFTLIACPRFHGSYWSSFSDAVVGCHAAGQADILFVE